MKTSALLAFAFAIAVSANAFADDLYLADGYAFPGQLWLSEGGTAERSILRRDERPNPAFANAVTKLGQITVGPDGKVYYISGLDGSVLHLLDGRHEVLSFEFDGQIRDLASTGEEHTVYFSVVATPQDGAPLTDGKIYRRDIWEGQPNEVATVRQAEVDNAWWGVFTIKDGAVYVATFGERSRIYKLTGRGAELAFEATTRVDGLSTTPDGDFLYVSSDGNVYRTRDFERSEIVLRTDRRLTDATQRASSEAPRP